MGSSGVGGTISAASDVFFDGVAQDDLLIRGSSHWQNVSATGKVALATRGGAETVSSVSASTSTTTLNLTNGNVFNVTLSANTTFAFSGAVAGRACSFALYLRQNGTGGFTAVWPASAKWSGGAPTLTKTANALDILVFESIDGGTTWYGSLVGTNFS